MTIEELMKLVDAYAEARGQLTEAYEMDGPKEWDECKQSIAEARAAVEKALRAEFGEHHVALHLSHEDALLVLGALNVSNMLRNTLAPVTEDQLAIGRRENTLAMHVLEVIAETDGKGPVTS